MVKSLKELSFEAVQQDPLHSLRSWRRQEELAVPLVLSKEPEPVSVFVLNLLKSLDLGWKVQKKVPEASNLFTPMYRFNKHAPALINRQIVLHFRKLQYWDTVYAPQLQAVNQQPFRDASQVYTGQVPSV